MASQFHNHLQFLGDYGSFAALILVPLESLLLLLGKEILTPFYVFQVFSLTWWTIDKEPLKNYMIRTIQDTVFRIECI